MIALTMTAFRVCGTMGRCYRPERYGGVMKGAAVVPRGHFTGNALKSSHGDNNGPDTAQKYNLSFPVQESARTHCYGLCRVVVFGKQRTMEQAYGRQG
jgi:hypothetical protein